MREPNVVVGCRCATCGEKLEGAWFARWNEQFCSIPCEQRWEREARSNHLFVQRTNDAPAKITTLDCDHCGDVAIESKSGWFGDGDGGRCISCGHPGHVTCDSETPAEWSTGQEATDFCAAHDCEECNDRRRDLIVDWSEQRVDNVHVMSEEHMALVVQVADLRSALEGVLKAWTTEGSWGDGIYEGHVPIHDKARALLDLGPAPRTDYPRSETDVSSHCTKCGVYCGEHDRDFACSADSEHEWTIIVGVTFTCECGEEARHRCPSALARHRAADPRSAKATSK